MRHLSRRLLLSAIALVVFMFVMLHIQDHYQVPKDLNTLYQVKNVWNQAPMQYDLTYRKNDAISDPVPNYSNQANQTTTTMNTSHQIKVILLSYMRSGSSLTADIIQQNENVFYVFEPLWTTEKFYLGQLPDSIYRLVSNVTLRIPKSREELTDRYNQVIDSFLNCRLEEIDVTSLTQYFMNLSQSTKNFLACAEDDTNLTRVSRCIKPLITACKHSRVVLLKVIRSNMQNLSSIYREDPNIKIIHLLRDPRGSLMSQLNVGLFKWREMSKAAHELCQRTETDISISKSFSKKYPNRIFTIRYEDIINFPLQMTHNLYTFLNLGKSINIEFYVWNITYGGYPDGCIICTNRSNATETANRWRQNFSMGSVQRIQKECINVFKILGYRTFNSTNELRNLLIPAQYNVYSNDLLKEVKVNR